MALAALGAGVAVAVNSWLPGVSAMLTAIVLGAIVANTVPAARLEWARPGLAIAGRRLLRAGVVLLGLQLVLADIFALGWPIVIGWSRSSAAPWRSPCCWPVLNVGATQNAADRRRFSICGAAAVAGIDGVLTKRKDAEAATAVALV